jgi:hypothetical protein
MYLVDLYSENPQLWTTTIMTEVFFVLFLSPSKQILG